MKCTKQPAFLEGKPTPITDVWEVRLSPLVWGKICITAKKHRLTFSSVTRFCVFELAERGSLRKHRKFSELLKQEMLERVSTKLRNAREHRHMVCFYGEDIALVRMAALRLGVTVSAFIRLALCLYLRYFAMDFHSTRRVTAEMIFWKGIKRWIKIPLTAINEFSLPAVRSFLFLSFPPEDRWGYPP